jgi:hypothetical protein
MSLASRKGASTSRVYAISSRSSEGPPQPDMAKTWPSLRSISRKIGKIRRSFTSGLGRNCVFPVTGIYPGPHDALTD